MLGKPLLIGSQHQSDQEWKVRVNPTFMLRFSVHLGACRQVDCLSESARRVAQNESAEIIRFPVGQPILTSLVVRPKWNVAVWARRSQHELCPRVQPAGCEVSPDCLDDLQWTNIDVLVLL